MDEDGICSAATDGGGYRGDGIVLNREDIDLRIFVDFIDICCMATAEFLCQFAGMFFSTTEDLQDVLSASFKASERCVARLPEPMKTIFIDW